MGEDVHLKVTIPLGNRASITGETSVPLEDVVRNITHGYFDHPKVCGDYDERTEYALREIAKASISVFKDRAFGEEEHKEQIKVYQKFVDYLEKKRKK
ncbi:MAG: hypothetical protein KKE93_01685 [Nanoarchaeota archaeon]|nr:hypothetical protein [Nanoarchaeota archaeon]